jgi:DNA invertase Pin-like site-specific DNA recombinase
VTVAVNGVIWKSGSPPDEERHKPDEPIRAAEYVRMSTEHQKYSTENQSEVIRRYAAERGYEIVRRYSDAGKSGLSLDGREALRQLIDDVGNGRADFAAILVYDVSRWGRFQDADEGAFLEYLCKRAGITVHFCAEQFENDGSLSATIMKSMKRAMAGEYSRELSTKVFAGQCRLISLGFRQGGSAGYGLRRVLVNERHEAKSELARGQQKSLQTDRVILAPGPPAEVQTVRRMYRLFVEQRRSESEIALLLNKEGIATDLGRPWTRGTVRQVLTNEKYIGNNVFNRVSFKLKQRRVRNPPEMLVRATGAFDALVDPDLFEAARAIIVARDLRLSDEQMLEPLRTLYARSGFLSAVLIDEQEEMPTSNAYESRFGSLLRAYEMVGYTPDRDYRYIETNRFLRALHPDIVADTVAAIEATGGSVVRHPATDLLSINDEFTASVVIARCHESRSGSLRWKIRFDAGLRPDITVTVRMNRENREVLDYYLLPMLDFIVPRIRLAEENGLHFDAYRFDTLAPFLDLTARSAIRPAA